MHLPAEAVVFAGDILFHQCTPLGWEGTFEGWVSALERILSLDPEVIVPGHGPLAGPDGARELIDYFRFVHGEVAKHHAAGLPPEEAARRIDLGRFAGWTQPERLVFQVDRAYRELRGGAYDEAGRLRGPDGRCRGAPAALGRRLIAVVSLMVVLSFSLLVTRVATVALVHTGLSREAARFQARSAFTGVGYTTRESETIVDHPVRRRIVMWLMLIGNIGIVTAISSLLLSVFEMERSGGVPPELIALLVWARAC